ncbi:MAG: DegT/DnrJ/EryC1/StrS family aminotransferase [Roseiarcus sp.]|jgi:dTDP-4-amino-4,6-dideoxygalactose transaminase
MSENSAIQVPLFKPLLEQEEFDAAQEALKLGWLGLGSYVRAFEAALEAMAGGGRRAIAVSTGHAALHLALLRMGVGPGDEVITPSFNNCADLQAIRATGAEPVFCDVEDDSLCIDLDSAASLVGPRTKAMIVMDYALRFCDHDVVADFRRRHGVRILHDAAHSFGSLWRGRAVGGFSDMTMFSFDAIKNITAIDGGALLVDEADVAWLQEARLIGMGQSTASLYDNVRAPSYDITHIGFRYHMANLHAAIALAQLAKIGRIGQTRREAVRAYTQAFHDIDGLRIPSLQSDDIVPFLYYVRVQATRRRDFCEHLKRKGIETGKHWEPGHRFSFFRDCRRAPLPVTERLAPELVTLPLHSAMAASTVERVIEAVTSFFAR